MPGIARSARHREPPLAAQPVEGGLHHRADVGVNFVDGGILAELGDDGERLQHLINDLGRQRKIGREEHLVGLIVFALGGGRLVDALGTHRTGPVMAAGVLVLIGAGLLAAAVAGRRRLQPSERRSITGASKQSAAVDLAVAAGPAVFGGWLWGLSSSPAAT